MPHPLEMNSFFVREKVGALRLHEEFDILDPGSGETVAVAQEATRRSVRWLKLLGLRRFLPFTLEVRDRAGHLLFTIRRGGVLLTSRVRVHAPEGELMGFFLQEVLAAGGRFLLHDSDGRLLARLSGDWTGWDFELRDPDGEPLGRVTKKWSGVGRELLTTADSYVVDLVPSLGQPALRAVMLSAALCVDMVLKED